MPKRQSKNRGRGAKNKANRGDANNNIEQVPVPGTSGTNNVTSEEHTIDGRERNSRSVTFELPKKSK